MKNQTVYFICGVSGSGKTTIAKLLAKKLELKYIDGDDFHPTANIDKMKSGMALNDEDRKSWLQSINTHISNTDDSIVIACSALKEKYRITLIGDLDIHFKWVFLHGPFDLIRNRMMARAGHFMPDALLQSQFDILDIPDYGLKIDIEVSPTIIIENIIQNTKMKKQLGLIGLGVMGKSLSRNFASKGVTLSLYNRFVAGKEENIAKDFIDSFPELSNVSGYQNLEKFVDSLASPRKIFMMISAGPAVDATIDALIPLLDEGDLIIDGGNSHYKLTQARNKKLANYQIYYIGTGVSGGEEGALKGPSIMPGGDKKAYQLIKGELESIAAIDKDQNPCCGHIGKGGSGHFVKMVHNGIEYAEMQLIAEVYGILKNGSQLSNMEISDIFETWLDTDTTSYLLEITVQILRKKLGSDDLIDMILDKAGNKGTGGWTTIAACELGVPTPTLTSALFARYQSSFKSERIKAEAVYRLTSNEFSVNHESLRNVYMLARIINHHQGIHLIQMASDANNWQINMAEVARIWTNGCIIRSAFMEDLKYLLKEPNELLLHPKMVKKLRSHIQGFRDLVSQCSLSGMSIPCFQASLTYIESYAKSQSTANIIQGQRDYFGAHRYQRKDDPSGTTYHTIWNS